MSLLCVQQTTRAPTLITARNPKLDVSIIRDTAFNYIPSVKKSQSRLDLYLLLGN